jgi:type II secretory pathway predicted ATPase ExeA
MDYLAHFNLSEEPFRLTPDPFYFYPSPTHNDVLASLNYAIEQKEGFSLVVGEPGTGKTTLVRVFINAWKDKAEIALIMTPRLSPAEFLAAALDDLKVKLKSKNKSDMIKAFRDVLVQHSSVNKPVIIIVDEAQDMPEETLEELRLLSNLETDTEKLLQIILIGQPELRRRLQSEGLKQLDQRISVRVTLKPLTLSETVDYISLRLIRAGKGAVIFDDSAKNALHRLSGGIPRVINLLASRSIMAAYLQGNDVVGRMNVLQAKRHVWGDSGFFDSFRKRALRAVVGAAAAVALCAGIGLLSRDANSHVSGGGAGTANTVFARPIAQIQTAATQPSPDKIAMVITPGANLRATPNISAEVVGEARGGARLSVVSEAADTKGRRWYNVGSEGKAQWLSQYVVKIQTAKK